jgi:hypothetical protein
MNYNIRPKDVVNFRLCDLKETAKSEYFAEKKKMVICYNKVKDRDELY